MTTYGIDRSQGAGGTGTSTTAVLADGSQQLTADWDAGPFEIRAQTFESDVTTGTAPFTVASTTVVTNLNADLLDGLNSTAFAILAGQSGGQTLIGGTASGDDLTLQATSNTTDGDVIFKTDPTTERMRLVSDGTLVHGHTTPVVGNASQLYAVNITKAEGHPANHLALARYEGTTNPTVGPVMAFLKSRHDTAGSHTVVNSGDIIGIIDFQGSDGDEFIGAAQIRAAVDGTPGNNDMPGQLSFWTTADGASSPTERARIDNAGRVVLGGVAAQAANSAGTTFPNLQMHGVGNEDTQSMLSRWSADANGHTVNFTKSRGATVGTHTVVQSGDQIGQIIFKASDGSVFQSAAALLASADGTWGSADAPGRLVFQTSPDGGATLTERARIDNAGNVVVNTEAIATNATNGFLYLPSMAGVPSGTPTSYTGRVPVVVDTTNSVMYMNPSGSAWVTGGKAPTVQTFTSSGTYTKPAGLKAALIMTKGGGGSGGGSATAAVRGGGGGEGQTSWRLIAASSIGATESVTINSAAAAINANTASNGNAGGTTSFGTLCTAGGGSGGSQGATGGQGGVGGSGGTNDWGERGARGHDGADAGATIALHGGGGGRGGANGLTAAAANTGAGGGGGSTASASGAGGTGRVVVIEYY